MPTVTSVRGTTMPSYNGQTTSKTRTKVKPILRKLTQSEKNSLDLDRPAAEQDGFGYGGGSGGVGAGGGAGGIYEYGQASRSSHDVVSYHTAAARSRGYHNRSTSGTSQFSTATTGSGHRAGSFVHPFQQTPRPYTPPLGAPYQNSLREDEPPHSPPLNEDDDPRQYTVRRASDRSTYLAGSASPTTTTIPTLRIQTKPSTSRLALATSNPSLHDSNPDIISPVETMSPSSLRASMDTGFRIRSRSEVDTRGRSETIQEARRKFEAREQAKEEKAARDEIRLLEKRNQREARQLERSHRRSSASELGTRAKRSKSDLAKNNEKTEGSFAQDYNNVPSQNAPLFAEADGPGIPPQRGQKKESPKHKTHGAWTKFMMWLRTRFLRMKR
ncbi:hypothetical protein LOCC1_G005909 [Lachnellula occidentalis]|uniref:Uncharacterized protein n=1 Tax=Lachnellula occidentalis TaxID=215460 RepID=A0A8H8S1E3_9HELO|nr:hypothetical protein LOCC1_G005909 [Lachnellula occidentalis]